MIYSYKKCRIDNPMLGATIFEDDKPIFVTAHKDGMEADDHNELAEYIISALFMIGCGADKSIFAHDAQSEQIDMDALHKFMAAA